MNNTVYIIKNNGQIEQVIYKELVLSFLETTTTPHGVAPRLHIREAGSKFEGWTWGYQGNLPKRIQTFDTMKEAEEWIFQCAELDFKNNALSPFFFNTLEEAEGLLYS
jgi:hypothetical protein